MMKSTICIFNDVGIDNLTKFKEMSVYKVKINLCECRPGQTSKPNQI